ncbi:MAG TPA: abortive phage resistance protein [Porphyromonadaceae bacterium]|nr:abortive phage resistance protein [Porphyromonadaceae bacterium]
MAKNDKILIDGVIDERIDLKLPSYRRDEVFEYFVFEQILKNYDLSTDEIIYGSVDGRNDGGIDGFFIFVNGHLLTEVETFIWPRSGLVLDVWIITCKHHDTFKQAPLDNLVASISELFDFSIEDRDLKGGYSKELLLQRNNLKISYKKTSSKLSRFNLNFYYASRGNTQDIGESVISRSEHLKQAATDNFGNCNINFTFCGSTELIDLFRKKPDFLLELSFCEYLSSNGAYILLVKLSDYYMFISDQDKLRRYLFDSNVRDYMGLNKVNEDIQNTLHNQESPDFWWLNNGVTILATNAIIVGKSIQVGDIQIVNGLQTSESIFRYFSSGGSDVANRSILVKVIVSNNLESRDEIIKATNNQTEVGLASLHATDKVQRNIEDALKINDLYYERRTNYYKNQGVSSDKILTPFYLAAGFINLIHKAPDEAIKLKVKFMRDESAYSEVFSHNTDLQVWYKIAYIMKQSDLFLESKRLSNNGELQSYLKNKRHFLSFIVVSKVIGCYNFNVNDLIDLDLNKLTRGEFEQSWSFLIGKMPFLFNRKRPKCKAFLSLCELGDNLLGIKGYVELVYMRLGVNKVHNLKKTAKHIDDITFEKVKSALPQQPWKPGMHKDLALKLGCSCSIIYHVIKLLIKQGVVYRQRDGVLYDLDDNVVSFDQERVDVDTLELKINSKVN